MPDKRLSKKVISGLLETDGRELAEIARDLGISKQRLTNYQKGDRFPDADFVQIWLKKYGQNIMDLIEIEGRQSTNVPRGTEKLTPVNKSNEKENVAHAEVYKTIVEGNTEYLLIPRSVLQEKYRLRSLEDIEKDKIVLDKILDANEKMLARILFIDPKFTGVQEGKNNP